MLALASAIGCLAILIHILWKRLVSNPLSAFPGPWLAAATGWYTTYYEVWKDGAMLEKLEELHRRYGMMLFIQLAVQ